MKTLSIIDTFGYFFRSFYAMPKLKSKDGFPTGVLLGFTNLVNQLYNDSSSHLIFALEGQGESIRKQIYANYKANRKETDKELVMQIEVAIEWIKKMNLASISIDGYEADDAIASLSALVKSKDVLVRIVSADKDLYQLIDSNTFIYDPMKKKEIREEECFEKFGVYPKQFIDFQSLVGDSSDNIPGIKGVGEKSAQALIAKFGTLENIFNNKASDFPNTIGIKLITKILENKQSAYMSRELVTLRDNLLDSFDLDSALKPQENPLFLIADELEKLNINILSKVSSNSTSNIPNSASKDFTYLNIDDLESKYYIKRFISKEILDAKELFEIIDKIPPSSTIVFDTETDSLSASANIVGFSFCTNCDVGYYVPLNHNYLGVENQISMQNAKIALQKLLSHHIIGHNLKFDMKVLSHNFNLEITNYSDTIILAWLLDSSQALNLDFQSSKNFAYQTIKFEDIVKKGDNFAGVSIKVATKYAVEDVICTLYLYNLLIKKLDKRLLEIAREVEFPFIKVLIDMESSGIGIDRVFFTNLGKEMESSLKKLSKEIFSLANCEFNINSTKQLSVILFETLKLKKGRALKSSSFSTDEKTLLALKDSHPIIPLLLEYRELNKLLTTYIVPFLNINKDSRIYTSFLQTGTSTGRLSSKSPNLQNIPVKTDIGRKIRAGFVAKEGYSFLSADYSQIELRLLAHFSKDCSLVESFRNDKDIHLQTAIKIFGEESAKEKRNIAKSINFGLIYGMGARKLSQTLNISQTEAKSYIESYFSSFPTVREFLSKKESEILELGYATTLLGRRRIFDFDNIKEYEKLAYLREGVNSIFQGSVADLIKLSMLECKKRFETRDVKLLLQVHDELIFEIKDSEISATSNEILEIMENIYKLEIPLKCGISIGKTWAELK